MPGLLGNITNLKNKLEPSVQSAVKKAALDRSLFKHLLEDIP
jgi:hypothetical protein